MIDPQGLHCSVGGDLLEEMDFARCDHAPATPTTAIYHTPTHSYHTHTSLPHPPLPHTPRRKEGGKC